MVTVLLYILAGAAVGAGFGHLSRRRAPTRQSAALYVSLGIAVALLVALVSHMGAPAEDIRSAFRRNGLIALAFFSAVLCAFGYQGLSFIASEIGEERRRRLLRIADLVGALAAGLVIAALALWNLSLTAMS